MKYLGIRYAAVITLLLCAGLSFAEEQKVSVDSLYGKAEVQKAGRNDWQLIPKGFKLDNNDIIRVLDASTTRLRWPDGSLIFIHANSQVLINLVNDKKNDMATKHVTVFFGSLFFIVKATLPRDLTKHLNVQVYTPTTVVGIRGTAFVTTVDKATGATEVKLINGTVLVRNIIKNVSLFLGAGYKTTVSVNTDPLLPAAMVSGDIDSLKRWVPSPYVETEIKEQLAKARKDHLVMIGKLENKAILFPLTNSSGYEGTWDIQHKTVSFLAEKLQTGKTNMIITTIDSLNPDSVSVDKIFAIGNTQKARYAITGDIESFDISRNATVSAAADDYREFYLARIKIKFQVIDIEAKKVIFENVFSADAQRKNKEENGWQRVGKLPYTLEDPAFAASIMGETLKQVLAESSEKIGGLLE